MSFLVRKCLVIHSLLCSVGFGRSHLCQFCAAQTWQLLFWVCSPWRDRTGVDCSEGFNTWKKHVLVLLVHMDFPWFVLRAVRLLCHSVLLLCTGRSCMYGWTCITLFLISFRKFSHFLSKASTFCPVIRISSVFLFTFYSRMKLWTWQYWFLIDSLPSPKC